MSQKNKKSKNDGKSIEDTIRSSKNKFFYRRVRMKDLSRYSEKDKSAVIGIRKKKVEVEEPEVEVKEPIPEPENPQVKKSELSVNDYFAQKMAKFYAKKQESKGQSNLEFSGTTLPKKESTPESPEINLEDTKPMHLESLDASALEAKKRRKMEKKARKLAKTQLE